MNTSPEFLKDSEPTNIEALGSTGHEQRNPKHVEHTTAELSPDQKREAIDRAKADATKEALMSTEVRGSETKKSGEKNNTKTVYAISKQHKDAEYKNTMRAIQSDMTPPARILSKVIHNPVVETTSNIVGSTIARPNAILAGSTTAFLVVALVYVVAKYYGYALSGFESIAAFVIGWIIGLTYDYIRMLIRGTTSN